MTSREECPICFTTDTPLLVTPCNHLACKLCLERLILSTNMVMAERDNINEDMETVQDCIVASCPTRGRCPLCRQYINMFDLKYHCCSPDDSSNTSSKNEHDFSKKEVISEENSDIMLGYAYDQNISVGDTSLAGMIFVPRGKGIGQQSIHFPPHHINGSNDDSDESDQPNNQYTDSEYDTLPYISFENIDEDHKLDNGMQRPKRKYFDTGSLRFHDKSKTFTGEIDWTMVGIDIYS